MTTITLNKNLVEKELGKIDEKLKDRIIMSGVEIDSISDSEIVLDITPNRPDLLSFQGFTRFMRNFLAKSKPKDFKVNKPKKDYLVKIEKPAKEWQYAACAIAKNLKFNDEKIKEIVDIQEKLTNGIGRKRKKLGLGVYPLDKISLPIKYTAKSGSEIKFQPLEFQREISGLQVLSQHPTGREYAHLVHGWERLPIFIDAKNKVLSMPPIVNSHETGKITEKTKDLFIECTGNNLKFVKKALNIFISSIADMGGEIYQMQVVDKESFISPDLSEEKINFKVDDINKTIGLNLNEKEIKNYLEKMGIKSEKQTAFIPAYRTDILHWIDLAEEVAIAYGYENLKPEIPKIATIAEEDEKEKLKRKVAEILSGLGLLEVSSYHLNTKEEIKKANYEFEDFIEVEKSKTEYNVLRINLMTNLLKIISENSDSSYPQKIFETGKVFEKDKKNLSETGIIEKNRLALAIVDEKANFTEGKKILDYLFSMLNRTYELKECESNEFISGRTGKIVLNKREIGIIGEIHPRVLKNWGINFPVTIFEINLEMFD